MLLVDHLVFSDHQNCFSPIKRGLQLSDHAVWITEPGGKWVTSPSCHLIGQKDVGVIFNSSSLALCCCMVYFFFFFFDARNPV